MTSDLQMDPVGAQAHADARAVLAVLLTLQGLWETHERASRGVLRRAIDLFWETPRSTQQGHRRRPEGALWSPDALTCAEQALAEGQESGRKSARWQTLVGEHVVPVKVQTSHLMTLGKRDVKIEDFIEALRVPIAVITVDEDRRLNKAKLRGRMPEGWTWGDDPWARYEKAGLLHKEYTTWPAAPAEAAAIEEMARAEEESA